MFTEHELNDLQNTFDSVAQGDELVNILSLKTLFNEAGFSPSDDMIMDLLRACGQKEGEDEIRFELFARCIALLIEENMNAPAQVEEDVEENHPDEYI